MDSIDLQYIKDMLVGLTEKWEIMSDRLTHIDNSLQRLNQTVIGDEKYGQKGLVQEVQELKKFADNEKMRNAKIMGGLAVVGFVWTYFYKFFFEK